jgi:transcriptional regulator with XRE-family HTH domain
VPRDRVGVVRSSGSIIREARLRAGLSQLELSERCGRDRAQIARWERDAVMPGFETLVELVRHCGFDVSLDLVEREEVAFPVLEKTSKLTPDARFVRMLQRRREQGAS